jgi:hypothetical protein
MLKPKTSSEPAAGTPPAPAKPAEGAGASPPPAEPDEPAKPARAESPAPPPPATDKPKPKRYGQVGFFRFQLKV